MRLPLLRSVFLLAGWLAPCVAGAQALLGSDCSALTQLSGQQQTIALSRPAAINQWIVVSVAVNNAFAQFDATSPVTDSASNSYPVYDAVAMAGGSGVLATFAGRATKALKAGDTITIAYTTTGSASAQACATATSFPGVLLLSDPGDATGEASGSGTALSVTASTTTQYPSELIYSAFASASTPGSMTALAPAQGLVQTCSVDTTVCVVPAWNLGATSSGISEGADASSANSVAWGALLLTFQSNDRIFANGFE